MNQKLKIVALIDDFNKTMRLIVYFLNDRKEFMMRMIMIFVFSNVKKIHP